MPVLECYRGVVHPWHCDVMGHFTTRHYAGMFDDASYHLLAAVGFRPRHIEAGIGFADVKATFTYKAELRAGDLFLIEGRIVRLGEKSLTARYAMKTLDGDVTAAEMESVCVQFDLRARRAVPISAEFRARAEALLEQDGT